MFNQSRRNFLKTTAALSALPLLAAGCKTTPRSSTPSQPQPQLRPNILLIMCDQLTASVLSCYGGDVPTPNIDRIAKEGIRFDNAVCTTPFCSPSRASIVTGLYPHAHRIIRNCSNIANTTDPKAAEGIHPTDITTEKILYDAGYDTHHYGKWHLDGDPLPYYTDMFRENIEYAKEMEPIFQQVRQTDKSNWMQWYNWAIPVEISPALHSAVSALGNRWDDNENSEFIKKMGRLKLPHQQNLEVRIADKTVDRIRSTTSKPFMITCSFNGPHDPNVIHSPYYEMFDPAKIRLPANRHFREKLFENNWSRRIVADLNEDCLREFLRIYYGCVKLIDDQVGRIFAALDAAQKIDNTVIIFTADHGDMAGGHGMVWKGTSAFYEEVARIPLLMRYPSLFKPSVCNLPVDNTDFMPTILALANQPSPSHIHGQNLVPFLAGQASCKTARRFSLSSRISSPNPFSRQPSNALKGSFMLRSPEWKYIKYSNDKAFLYHISKEHNETKDVLPDPMCYRIRQEFDQELENLLQKTGWPT